MQRRLRQLVVVQVYIALNRLAHIFSRVEAVDLQYIRDASIKAFGYPIGMMSSLITKRPMNSG